MTLKFDRIIRELKYFIGVFFLSVVVLVAPAEAWHSSQVKNTWGGDGPAIHGYDPVAYFTLGEAMKGSDVFTHDWLGAEWHFVTAEHRDLFAQDPTKYAPQHGGYCAVGASGGGTFIAEPESWRIEDGKLYLFYSEETASRFNPGSAEVVEADANWQNQLLDLLEH
ncbi:MAG: YHS domain-containing protein [Gammaproteobacteria bacterium]|nr:YHS domain-containing protein [Gammaproteobacteria bacterium]